MWGTPDDVKGPFVALESELEPEALPGRLLPLSQPLLS